MCSSDLPFPSTTLNATTTMSEKCDNDSYCYLYYVGLLLSVSINLLLSALLIIARVYVLCKKKDHVDPLDFVTVDRENSMTTEFRSLVDNDMCSTPTGLLNTTSEPNRRVINISDYLWLFSLCP